MSSASFSNLSSFYTFLLTPFIMLDFVFSMCGCSQLMMARRTIHSQVRSSSARTVSGSMATRLTSVLTFVSDIKVSVLRVRTARARSRGTTPCGVTLLASTRRNSTSPPRRFNWVKYKITTNKRQNIRLEENFSFFLLTLK